MGVGGHVVAVEAEGEGAPVEEALEGLGDGVGDHHRDGCRKGGVVQAAGPAGPAGGAEREVGLGMASAARRYEAGACAGGAASLDRLGLLLLVLNQTPTLWSSRGSCTCNTGYSVTVASIGVRRRWQSACLTSPS